VPAFEQVQVGRLSSSRVPHTFRHVTVTCLHAIRHGAASVRHGTGSLQWIVDCTSDRSSELRVADLVHMGLDGCLGKSSNRSPGQHPGPGRGQGQDRGQTDTGTWHILR